MIANPDAQPDGTTGSLYLFGNVRFAAPGQQTIRLRAGAMTEIKWQRNLWIMKASFLVT